MNEKRIVLMGIIVGTLACLVGTASKVKADTLNLTSVMQVATRQIEGKGNYATAGTIVSMTMYVNDPNNKQVSKTPCTVVGQNWASITTVNGGLTVGIQYTVYAEMITTLNGVQTTTYSTPLAITIAAKP